MAIKKTQEQILRKYEQKSEFILQRMMQVLLRSQRKVEDEAYRRTIVKLENIQKNN